MNSGSSFLGKLAKFRESIIIGSKEIVYNKMRSLLNIIGIILGVTSLLTMIGIIRGAKQHSLEVMNQYGGLDKITIRYMEPEEGDTGVLKHRRLYMSDVYALAEKHTYIIRSISPELSGSGRLKYQGRRLRTREVFGITESFLKVNDLEVARGRTLSAMDDISQARVALIGSIFAREFFGDEDPIGKSIEFLGHNFKIVGILKHYEMASQSFGLSSGGRRSSRPAPKKTNQPNRFKSNEAYQHINFPNYSINVNQTNGPLTQQEKNISRRDIYRKYGRSNPLWYKNMKLLIPYSTFQILIKNTKEIDQITVRMKDTQTLLSGVEQIRNTLKKERGGIESFEITTQAERFDQLEQQISLFNTVLGSIAAISLMVGGIGIMNVILSSISERIREIGVRKSVGATNSDIFFHFLIETTLLSILGGILGIGISFSAAALITRFSALTVLIPIQYAFAALGFSSIIGIAFGIYPSFRAAKLNPINALHYE